MATGFSTHLTGDLSHTCCYELYWRRYRHFQLFCFVPRLDLGFGSL